MSKNIRLEDLASIAGVSIATVSRALNNSAAVNEQTKRRIWKLAREHGYGFRPHMPTSLDRAVLTITIVVPTPQGRDAWLPDPFFLELLGGIGAAARDRRCDVLISHLTPRTFEDLSQLFENNHTDSVIFLGQSFLHGMLNKLASRNNRFIVWGADLPGQRYCSIGSDNIGGGRRATAHLARLGRKSIAFLGDREGPEIRQRFEGYQQALAQAGLDFNSQLVSPAHFEIESAEAATDALLAKDSTFDAVFASSDTIALGALRSLYRRGIRVPEDVSIVGYDDLQLARYVRPALTTISQDLAKAGRHMVSKLLNAKNTLDMVSERLPTNVIVRESCGA